MSIIAQMWRLSGEDKPGRDEPSGCGADIMADTCMCFGPKRSRSRQSAVP